jgi:hypothetical protein
VLNYSAPLRRAQTAETAALWLLELWPRDCCHEIIGWTTFSILEADMIARVATFDHLVPEDQGSEAARLLRDTIRGTPGYVAGFHLHDPKSNEAMSIVVYEDPRLT